MGRSKKRASFGRSKKKRNDEDVDFETLVREEFKKLHRQYRLMEDARHSIAGASGILSKQGQILNHLRHEKEELLTDIRNARSRPMRLRDRLTIRTILEALERYEKYKMDITTCCLSIAEMEANVDRITQRLVEQKLKVQAMYGQSMTVPNADHRTRILENKLYYVTTQFDTLVSDNRDLKQEINMMLKVRGNFYRRMLAIKKISGKIKQRMGEVVYDATASYDEREEWVTKINLLRERNDKDSKQHVLEIKEFQRILHHDSKLHEFLSIKNKDRKQVENAAQRQDRKNQVKIAELDSLLGAYKRSFKAILRMAKSADIETLVQEYLEEEKKNFDSFRIITDLNSKMNRLQDQIVKIKGDIDDLVIKNKISAKQQQEDLAVLDKQLETETSKLEKSMKQWAEVEDHMAQYGKLLGEACASAGCSNVTIVQALGQQTEIRHQLVPTCMKLLEDRVADLIYYKGVLEIRKLVELENNHLPKKPHLWVHNYKIPPAGPFRPTLHITGRVDAEQDEDDGETRAWSEGAIYWEDMYSNLRDTKEIQAQDSPSQEALGDLTFSRFTLSSITIPQGRSVFFPPIPTEPEPVLVPISPAPAMIIPPKRVPNWQAESESAAAEVAAKPVRGDDEPFDEEEPKLLTEMSEMEMERHREFAGEGESEAEQEQTETEGPPNTDQEEGPEETENEESERPAEDTEYEGDQEETEAEAPPTEENEGDEE